MPTQDPRYPADFDQATWGEDFARSTDAGRLAGDNARREFEESGVPQSQLRPCNAEGQDGTTLPRCVKTYVPQPTGRFGIVFRVTLVDRRLRLRFLAFGVRHHPPNSNAPTVYQLAHNRLHDPEP
jgi:hypothetical protein